MVVKEEKQESIFFIVLFFLTSVPFFAFLSIGLMPFIFANLAVSSLFNFIVTNIIYYCFLSVASSPESAQEIFLFPHVSYALYQ